MLMRIHFWVKFELENLIFIKITVNNFNFDSKFVQTNGFNLEPTKKSQQLISDHAQVQKNSG